MPATIAWVELNQMTMKKLKDVRNIGAWIYMALMVLAFWVGKGAHALYDLIFK